ncbi:leucine-rich repeat flightless-interacting protein 2-like [Sycon ciliatum]|uniref:leucine-rich repeat flightless-interacting protein 2-like n=1 Tax=Sycon ciliatum TaxID=27933 RepID=UPI0020AC4CC2|eukprot:scpid85637/ scgid6512/ Leucine-rich repeat flightless-interacting protein 2
MASNGQNADGGRARGPKEASAEERAIQTMMDKGEQDLAMKREARARARKLRFEELQRQKESEEREGDGASAAPRSTSSSMRLDLEENLPEDPSERLVFINQQLKDTLLLNSQLHSDKMQLVYQLDLYKDRLEDFDQDVIELKHYNRATKQDLAVTQHQLQLHEQQVLRLRQEIEARDTYLKDCNIPWPPPPKEDVEPAKGPDSACDSESMLPPLDGQWSRSASRGNSYDMDDLNGDDKKKKMDSHAREKQFLLEQIGRLKQEVILLKNELQSQALTAAGAENGAVGRDVMRDTARLLSEYKTKLLALETDKTRLEGQMQRADTQLKRLRTQREEAEKLEDDLKSERRKLQRDVRQALSHAEELELENERLQKRIETLRKRHQKE